MSSIFNQLINLVQFTSGRRLYALMAAREEAQAMGLASLVARIDEAIEHDRLCRIMDNDWVNRNRGTRYAAEVKSIDQQVDTQITALRDTTAAFTQGSWRGTEHEEHASIVLRSLFPNGVRVITALPYVDQVAAVEAVLEQLDDKLATQVSFLGLGVHVDKLRQLAAEYRAAVQKGPSVVLFSEVEAARATGQANLHEVVITILGQFPRHDDADQERARLRLLKPILRQDAEIRARIRARRAVTDVDPETGLDEEPVIMDESPEGADPVTDADPSTPVEDSEAAG